MHSINVSKTLYSFKSCKQYSSSQKWQLLYVMCWASVNKYFKHIFQIILSIHLVIFLAFLKLRLLVGNLDDPCLFLNKLTRDV